MWAIGCASLVFLAASTAPPSTLVELWAWAQFFMAIVVGACFTGWRITQFPKSRAAEFTLVTPISDRELVATEVLTGVAKTVLVVFPLLPFTCAMWGAGWISKSDMLILTCVPVSAGVFAGICLAVVSYEPSWVRRSLEYLLLAGVVAYMVLFGLLGAFFARPLLAAWGTLVGTPLSGFMDVGDVLRFSNPFRLLGSVGDVDQGAATMRTLLILGLIWFLTMAGYLRLACRLRPHYEEENYGRQRGRRDYSRPMGQRPLSWWTRRRVSRFRGRINLYLTWATVAVYTAWTLMPGRWPPWLAVPQLQLLESLGGLPLLLAACLHLAVVPAAFLQGLWDSHAQQRARRLELLLTTPLEAGDYLLASLVAAWTRGRGYILPAAILSGVAIYNRNLQPVELAWLCLAMGNYLLLSFAVAFRNFARLPDDRSVTVCGLLWSVGLPVLTIGLALLAEPNWTFCTPLGAVYQAATGSSTATKLFLASQCLYALAGIFLLRSAVLCFDREIHDWFAGQLGPEPSRRSKTSNRWFAPTRFRFQELANTVGTSLRRTRMRFPSR